MGNERLPKNLARKADEIRSNSTSKVENCGIGGLTGTHYFSNKGEGYLITDEEIYKVKREPHRPLSLERLELEDTTPNILGTLPHLITKLISNRR